ncbi:hypothetical protein GCM10007973_17130 [Polymorphobacter multimanifer]|uniref:hypothetical protein n=1 Tax=Polymorphobacter multimanifer TaxID=1070431 RepID=UPI00166F2F45|nr:hypothetical protein [Polymorphobacter multimanifer]GGI81201.1 hypothetical protein GCM10007973_17130 [Polymorphobacter multimanifer]
MSALLRAIGGWLAWAVGFSILYGLHGVACALGWPAIRIGPGDLQRLVLAFAWIVSVGAIAAWTWLQWRAAPGKIALLDWLARGSAAAGLFAMVISGLPVVLSAPCGTDAVPWSRGTIGMVGCSNGTRCRPAAPSATPEHGEALAVRDMVFPEEFG